MRCLLPLAGLSLLVTSGFTAGVGLAGLFMLGGATCSCCCRPQRRDRPEYV
jgi:hypothetical protein